MTQKNEKTKENITTDKPCYALDRLKAVAIEATSEGIALLNRDGEYFYLNQAHIELFGYNHESQLLGKKWHSIYSAAEIDRIENEIFPVLLRDGRWKGETVGLSKDGQPVYQIINLTLLSDGNMICITDCINKIRSQFIDLKQSNARLEAVFSSISDGVLLESKNRKLLAINKKLQDYFDFQIDDVQNKEIDCREAMQFAKIRVVDPDSFVSNIEATFNNGTIKVGEVVNLLNGKILHRDFIPIHNDNQVYGYLWVYHDMTEIVKRSLELEKVINRERELGILRSKFFHIVTHEFKRPVITVLEGLNSLKSEFEGLEELRILTNGLTYLMDELQKLNKHVNQVVGYENLLMEKTIKLTEVNLNRFLENSLSYSYGMYYSSGKFVINEEHTTHCITIDLSLFDILIRNIVDNAVKYSHPSEKIFVSSKISDNVVVFKFENISRKDSLINTKHLGSPMYRGGNNDDNGLGLGLSIIRNIAAIHKGTATFNYDNQIFGVNISLPVVLIEE